MKNDTEKVNDYFRNKKKRIGCGEYLVSLIVKQIPEGVLNPFGDELSEYLHIYTKVPSDMSFASEFIQNGIRKAKEAIDFVENFFVKDEKGLSFGSLHFETLTGSFKEEFEKWKKDVSEDTEGLFNRLKAFNDKEFGGAKAKAVME